MATENTTLVINSITRVSGDTEATINLGNQYNPPIYVGSTIKITNRLNGSYLPEATVTEVTNGNTIIVTGLSEEDVSDFVITDDELGASGIITNTYPVTA